MKVILGSSEWCWCGSWDDSGRGACPNLPQRRSGPGSAADKTAEYQRFSLRAPARPGPLWQIWTTGATAGPVGRASPASAVHDANTGADTHAEGGRGPGGRPVRPRRPRPSAARPARRRPGPRERGLTIENEGLTPVLMDQPPSSWAGAAGPRDHHDRPRGPTHPHPMIHITQHTQTPPE